MNSNDGLVLVALFALAIVPIFLAARLSERKGRSVAFGVVLGIFLGWIGLLIVALLPSRTSTAAGVSAKPRSAEAASGDLEDAQTDLRERPCPSCDASIACVATTCPSCGSASTPWTLYKGRWWMRNDAEIWHYLDERANKWVPNAFETPQGPDSGDRAAASSVGLDHVQVAAPPGREFDIHRFYLGLLGLPEIDKPSGIADGGGCWFDLGTQQLHVGVMEGEAVPAVEAHAILRVRDVELLEEIAERLVAAGYDVTWPEEGETRGARRFHVFDPFGNRLELLAQEQRR